MSDAASENNCGGEGGTAHTPTELHVECKVCRGTEDFPQEILRAMGWKPIPAVEITEFDHEANEVTFGPAPDKWVCPGCRLDALEAAIRNWHEGDNARNFIERARLLMTNDPEYARQNARDILRNPPATFNDVSPVSGGSQNANDAGNFGGGNQ